MSYLGAGKCNHIGDYIFLHRPHMDNPDRVAPFDHWTRRILPLAKPDVQTQGSRIERLNGLRGMAWAYATCHHLWKKPSAVSLEFSAPECSFGSSNGRKRSSNLMHYYIAGRGAPMPGARGKFGFDLVGAISSDPRGACAEKWLEHRLWKMLNPDITLRGLRELLYEMPLLVRQALFDMDPARESQHVAWRRRSLGDSAVPEIIEGIALVASGLVWHPREAGAENAFQLFEALVGLWCEARLLCDGARMRALLDLIIRTQGLALADETFVYVIAPFLAFLSFDGPDHPPGKVKKRPAAIQTKRNNRLTALQQPSSKH